MLKANWDWSQVKTLEDVKFVLSSITGAVQMDIATFNQLGEKKAFFILEESEVEEVKEEK